MRQFLFGVLVAYTPSLLFVAWMILRSASWDTELPKAQYPSKQPE